MSWNFLAVEKLDCFRDLFVGVIILVESFKDAFISLLFVWVYLKSSPGSVFIFRLSILLEPLVSASIGCFYLDKCYMSLF